MPTGYIIAINLSNVNLQSSVENERLKVNPVSSFTLG